MGDPLYTGNIYFDNLTIKSEPMAIDSILASGGGCVGGGGGGTNQSASVPIPNRRTLELMRDEGFGDFAAASPFDSSYLDSNLTGSSLYSSSSVWSPRGDIKMEDDDIFQVDKNDLIQGPTLAELNANDDTLLDDLTFDDLMLPEDGCLQAVPLSRGISPIIFNEQQLAATAPVALSFPPDGGFYRDFNPIVRTRGEVSPASHHSSESSSALQTVSPPPAASGGAYSPIPPNKPTTLHDLLLKNSLSPTPQQTLGQSVPGRFNGSSASGGSSGGSTASSSGANKRSHHASRLSSSAPTHLGLDQIWARREPRQHLLSTGSMAEATSTSSISTSGVLSPDGHDFSLDDCFDSEDDSDHEEDYSSGGDESNSDNENGSTSNKSAKRERFFWQYNVQSKGPKGQRLVLKTKQEDPHRLNEVTDPVFSPQCSVQGIKHSGKARKGDGNDLTPNPRKLVVIGKELDKLNRTINDMTPVSELPFNVRSDTRKEKNKLASRACRLKKKAQHEANKIKLHGLECEHKKLMNGINQMKNAVIARVSDNPPDPTDTSAIDKIVKSATRLKIAGQTTEFVNKVLEKMKQGVANGGLDDMHSQHSHQSSNN